MEVGGAALAPTAHHYSRPRHHLKSKMVMAHSLRHSDKVMVMAPAPQRGGDAEEKGWLGLVRDTLWRVTEWKRNGLGLG